MRPIAQVTILVCTLIPLASCEMARSVLEGSKKPSARIVDVRFESLRLDGVDLALGVEVTNPYDVAVPILGLDFALASEGRPFLKGSLREGGTIESGGSRVLPVQAKVAFADLLKVIGDVKPGAVIPYAIDAGVSVDAPVIGKLRLPVRHAGKLPIPRIPDVSLGGIEFGKIRLDEVEAVLKIDVANGNAFPIDLAELSFGLSLAGQHVVDTRTPGVTTLKEGAATRLEIPVSFSPLRIGLATTSILTGSGSSYAIAGKLSARTPFGPLSVPLEVSGNAPFAR